MEYVTSSIEIDLEKIQSGLKLYIDARTPNSLFDIGQNNPEYNEARYQLVEGCYYDYEFSDDRFNFKDVGYSIVQPHRRNKSVGRLAPNIYTGTLNLPLLKNGEKIKKDFLQLEVRSVKTTYREDYRTMLEYITEKSTDLLLQSTSPTQHYFVPDFEKDSQTLYQRFAFLQSIVNTDEFEIAIHRIITRPATQWIQKREITDIRSVKRFSGAQVRQLAKGTQRGLLPKNHPLRKRHLNSIPIHIEDFRKTDSLDTPENRFIKYSLESFLRFVESIRSHTLSLKENDFKKNRLIQETEFLIQQLESHLHHSFFKEISNPTTLRLNSPVLQKREGYREILRVWLMFDLAAKLIWKGGEDVYGAGKKDVANLYEYWLFFQLLDILSEKFDIPPKETKELITYDKNRFTLNLKQGKIKAIRGVYSKANRDLNICFNYNRSFNRAQSEDGISYPHGGSWTANMRPDYTLSIWPKGITEKQAEKDELIVHIHFDAKYKIENFKKVFDQKTSEELNQEKEEEKKGVYKNADLLKMHAYKDAIRRTGGAYVLYPGDEVSQFFGFHEIVPGLGAFALNPKEVEKGKNNLSKFIDQVIEHFLNQSSQREKMAYRRYTIHEKPPNNNVAQEPVPLNIGENRDLIPDDTPILVGYYKSENHLKWIDKNGLVNFRTGTRPGSIPINSKTINAKFILLHTRGDTHTSKLYRIQKEGPKIYSKTDLINKNYPSDLQGEHYLVFSIKPVEEVEFKDQKWNFKKLQNYRGGRQSAYPFTTTLTDLLLHKFNQ